MKISSNKQIPKIYYDLIWCLSSYFMVHLTQHTSIVLYHTNFPHIKYQPWTFPSLSVVLIAMTNSSSARRHLIWKVHVITVYSMVSNVFSCGGGGDISNGLPRCWCLFIPAQLFSLHPKPQKMPAQQPCQSQCLWITNSWSGVFYSYYR
jgi:hypothetical protein